MFRRDFFGASPFSRRIPTARLAGGPRLGQHSGLACCNAPNGYGYCFDSGSGECVATWVSASGGPPGSPACVTNAQGQITHPSCLGLEPEPSPGRPELPAGCTYVAAPNNPMQEVICECYNCTTKQSDGWRGPLGEFIAMGLQNPCLKSPEWFPKPAVCPAGPGGGGTYTPPPPTAPPPPPPPPVDYPAPTPGAEQPATTSATRAFCGPSGGPFTIVEIDPVTQDPIRIVAVNVEFGDPAYEWTGVINNPPWCAEFLEPEAAAPAPAPTPTPTPDVIAPPPTPDVIQPPPLPPVVTPGAEVPIAPGPFPAAPAPSHAPLTPARSFQPSMRPACQSTPYFRRVFPSTTVAARPGEFPDPSWIKR